MSTRRSPSRGLTLADLSSTALKSLGLRRSDLIDTEKDQYPGTRIWAEAIHAARPLVESLCWVSRQDDRALAVMLFGDRIPTADLTQADALRDILAVPTYSLLLKLAQHIGVDVVGGR
jgi:RES domain